MKIELCYSNETILDDKHKYVVYIDDCMRRSDDHCSPVLAVPTNCKDNEAFMTYLKQNVNTIVIELVQFIVAAAERTIVLVCTPDTAVDHKLCIEQMLNSKWFKDEVMNAIKFRTYDKLL